MIDRKLNEFGVALLKDLRELNYRQAEDIREVLNFDYYGEGKTRNESYIFVVDCSYEVSNYIYDDEKPYAKLIDISIDEMTIEIDDRFLNLYRVDIDEDEETEIASFVLSAIRNIYYLYEYATFDLIFEYGDYFINLNCTRFE